MRNRNEEDLGREQGVSSNPSRSEKDSSMDRESSRRSGSEGFGSSTGRSGSVGNMGGGGSDSSIESDRSDSNDLDRSDRGSSRSDRSIDRSSGGSSSGRH